VENFNDVSDAFGDFLQVVYATRSGGGYVDGRWVSSAGTQLTFPGVVQSAVPNDMKVLAEGQRTEEAIKIHTTFKLIPQSGAAAGDVISYNTDSWRVYNVAHRYIGGYHKAIAIRQ